MDNVKRHLIVLEKGEELFVFGYEPGQEDRVLDALIEQAKDERTDLNWFDVAMLELKLTETAHESPQNPLQPHAEQQRPAMPDRFQLPCDGPLWFMRGLFGPDGKRPPSR
jgi:hypothetical protein